MHLRRSLLSIAVFLVGVSAVPAPQHKDGSGNDVTGLTGDGTVSNNSTVTDTNAEGTAVVKPSVSATPTESQVAPSTPVVLTTTPVETTPVVQRTVVQTTTAQPTLSPSPTQQQTSSSESVESVTPTAFVETSSTPVPTEFPTITESTPTASATSTTSSTATAENATESTSKGGVNTKTILIVGASVGGVVVLAFIAFSIFRKLKLKPSESFEQRLAPTGSTGGHLEEWNDPRTFRGYMQNESSANSLGRSNSQASSAYSYDAADEKAGGGLGRQNTGLGRQNTGLGRQTTGQWGHDEKHVFENGDGLREDGRGYRGF